MQIGAYLYFRISGESLDFDAITSTLQIRSCTCLKKGDVNTSLLGDNQYLEDVWMADYEIPSEQSLTDAFKFFIQPFLKHREFILALSKNHSVKLWLSLYPENNCLDLTLSTEFIALLHCLQIELGIIAIELSEFY